MIFIEKCYKCTSNDDVNDQTCFVVKNDTDDTHDSSGLLKSFNFQEI
jgi:hypothetical protein